jgi:hypothetical protein
VDNVVLNQEPLPGSELNFEALSLLLNKVKDIPKLTSLSREIEELRASAVKMTEQRNSAENSVAVHRKEVATFTTMLDDFRAIKPYASTKDQITMVEQGINGSRARLAEAIVKRDKYISESERLMVEMNQTWDKMNFLIGQREEFERNPLHVIQKYAIPMNKISAEVAIAGSRECVRDVYAAALTLDSEIRAVNGIRPLADYYLARQEIRMRQALLEVECPTESLCVYETVLFNNCTEIYKSVAAAHKLEDPCYWSSSFAQPPVGWIKALQDVEDKILAQEEAITAPELTDVEICKVLVESDVKEASRKMEAVKGKDPEVHYLLQQITRNPAVIKAITSRTWSFYGSEALSRDAGNMTTALEKVIGAKVHKWYSASRAGGESSKLVESIRTGGTTGIIALKRHCGNDWSRIRSVAESNGVKIVTILSTGLKSFLLAMARAYGMELKPLVEASTPAKAVKATKATVK